VSLHRFGPAQRWAGLRAIIMPWATAGTEFTLRKLIRLEDTKIEAKLCALCGSIVLLFTNARNLRNLRKTEHSAHPSIHASRYSGCASEHIASLAFVKSAKSVDAATWLF
jgi:hypothetical protein